MKDIAAFLTMDRTTLTAALKKLERDRMVEVAADPKDGRSRLVSLTPKGRRILDRAKAGLEGGTRASEAERDIDAGALRRTCRRSPDARRRP